ncbi:MULTISPECIES: nucleoside-diphosphate sugar epimerase/dehydratase [unclassified Paenibacillus]|uniref:polysaccharide biosynthesis protein n=1 Tax=unclassified Paenibacillus TaxID=185978 RepID=UPI00240534AD|nr:MULTISPECIES: nucleoside-diphosphate sugar epimerase/dehydratase [unclassified Paenibacillus]MDF9844056.1 FlaA1/EpsC-like NDP-sugar epimerase [Paenibacillus sp. PastF-2]MDF9850661.1 FlaA1/EpsC-like NDP-sugar epimerase [Paenibacillus sp. PastM-2]MDF9857188.1 FlaA1/EpsC-like NDP-sugar epimerase [Paenibacillus sp. PastF-1]MDH6482511.1 FlaA1/EpsC-like NDP-sugar epimerase [Paenibacillus sp. PastH-2]MDH6509886.1 FlaA1/EpsC-like NDP-sugar epimerase [Paenibacillus sp. PastM-3]
MTAKTRVFVLFFIDLAIIWFSIVTSYLFRFYSDIPEEYIVQMLFYGIICTLSFGGSLIYFGLYRRLWQYASIGEIVSVMKAIVVGAVISYAVAFVMLPSRVPFSIEVRSVETILLLVGGVRLFWRVFGRGRFNNVDTEVHTLIVGAGDCGMLIARELMGASFANTRLIGFVDDSVDKLHLKILGVPVLGNRYDIPRIVKDRGVHEVIIAMPSVSRSEISEIVSLSKATGVKLKIIPALSDLITGKVSIKKLRDVSVEDLLGREPIVADMNSILGYVHNKTVLVTGAGGSIGSELCRQISPFAPDKLLILGHGENSIYTIEMELRKSFPELSIVTVIADVQDRTRMMEVFESHKPQVVFHAAAHKHVPLMERNPSEAIKNNVFGTRNVADCADKYGAERFVLISSDKAVNPTSVMGATKRIAEMYVQSLNTTSNTKFSAVRFGNVLGSRGSVIPAFKQQIAAGGPVTVTHPEMVRYFMTIPEAVQLVIQSGSFAKGGEVFVLDMGEPVKILTLAEDLITLSGYEPYKDINIVFSGIREGEKLYEELLTDEENLGSTQHDRIFIGKPNVISQNQLELEFKRLERVLSEEPDAIREVINQIVPMQPVAQAAIS